MIWQISILLLIALELGVVLSKHGENKEGKYSLWISLFSAAVLLFILYKGGFFNSILS